jgi:hypothetical protein
LVNVVGDTAVAVEVDTVAVEEDMVVWSAK